MPPTHYTLDQVFTPGSQPTVTYVGREELGIERSLKRAVALPTAIVSLTGATKSGKTVLCRNVLEGQSYVWIEGGQIKSEQALWDRACHELNVPVELTKSMGTQDGVSTSAQAEAEASIGFIGKLRAIVTASGSHLSTQEATRKYHISTTAQALQHLVANKIVLVIDDFHYIPSEDRQSILRSLRGAIFQGLKVVLLSTPYRAFEAIRAEPEITGRLTHVEVPDWREEDLKTIPALGFDALNVRCHRDIVSSFAHEANGSPLLMQSFCWELCFDLEILESQETRKSITKGVNVNDIFKRVAKDSGQPIYDKLAAGPVTRTPRIDRPLKNGGAVDIYKAILIAISETGPGESVSYDEIRAGLGRVLSDKIPQKIEVSNSLKHLDKIGSDAAAGAKPIEWDEDTRTLHLSDPYLRFYLRWQIKGL